jgi:hypothetical protein
VRILPATAPPNIERTIERWLVYSEDEVYGCDYRVDRVQGFFANRPHWDPPTPTPAGEGTDTVWNSRYTYVLCGLDVPLRWSLMCSRVAAMSISLDPLVMRFRTMSMSMYVPDRPTPSLRYTKFRYFYTASSNFCENFVFCKHFIAEKLSKLNVGFW